MKPDVLNYIKQLSLADKKTLSQKALKLSEETGELAKVVLPYDGAPGTIHRFVDQQAILEESVDVILTAISIPFQLGFTIQDIEDMMVIKSRKWKGIQLKEDNMNDKLKGDIPFEVHVTFKITSQQIDSFKNACKQIGVKPIVIELESQGEVVMQDVMTSSTIFGGNGDAILHANSITEFLMRDHGYEAVRTKIETIPWHPMAPHTPSETMPGNCYFEAHIGCVITQEQKEELEYIAIEHNAHLSKNAFKKLQGDKFVNMITIRETQLCFVEFENNVKDLIHNLDTANFDYEKVIYEFAVYDTNINHDFLWINQK